MFLATGIQEYKRNNFVKDLNQKYLFGASNDHLRVLAGEKVSNSGASYQNQAPQQQYLIAQQNVS